MSTKKGNNAKKGQRHQNTKAYKNDLHDTSKKTRQINSLVVGGVCARCREIIEWRKKFNKYKPLNAPKKWYISFPVQLWIVAFRILCYENTKWFSPPSPPPIFNQAPILRRLPVWRFHLAVVGREVDNAIHWINHEPVDSMVCFVDAYPLDVESIIHLLALPWCKNLWNSPVT